MNGITDLNLLLLAGGRHVCTSAWNKPADRLDQCYKFYFPVRGGAFVELADGPRAIRAGNIYFLSGFRLRRQFCPRRMDVYWVHFVPESLRLQYLLDRAEAVHAWPENRWAWARPAYRRLPELFENPFGVDARPRPDRPLALTCRIEALLMLLLSDLLEAGAADAAPSPTALRLSTSLAFMDERYRESPSLAEVARRAGLAPNHFHRVFAREFGVTPFGYMERRRLDQARHLLTGTALAVKEVAAAVGYDNPLYFSRVFTRHFGRSPRAFRGQGQTL